jgi:hypothetical protein
MGESAEQKRSSRQFQRLLSSWSSIWRPLLSKRTVRHCERM